MTLPELSVRRPVFAWVIALLIAALGLAALGRLPVREYPDVDPPRVSVSITYPGAAADVVERDVTRVVEDNLNGIEGVELIDSRSRAGFSQISIEFVLGRDLDAAAADVRDRVSAVRGELPEEAEPPVFRKAGAEAQAMMWITLTSQTRDRKALTDLAVRRLTDPISILPGVSQVILGGARRYALRIWLDRERLSAMGVTTTEVAQALRRENLEAPAGRIEAARREYTLRTDTKLPDAAAFRDLILRESDGGTVRLGDVARIELGAESDRSAVFRDGKPAIGLGIVRQSNANTLSVAALVREELETLRERLPEDVDVSVSYDQSIFIEGSIRQVLTTLLITVGLVVAVVYLSLGRFRAAAAPAATIPVSALGAIGVMLILGFTVNTLTLLALVLAIGLVVDDAIVVVESAIRRAEEGRPPRAAAAEGAARVFFAVIATTAVLVAVLVPIAALGGLIGRLFTEFALTLAAAVVCSSLLALTIGAALSARAGAGAPSWAARKVGDGLGWLERRYERLARGIVAAPWFAAIITVVLGASGWWILGQLPGGLAPTEDRGVFIVAVEAPPGATLAATTDVVREVEAVLDSRAGEGGPIDEVISIVGAGTSGPPEVRSGLVIAKLKPWGERDIAQMALVGELTPALLGITGGTTVPINPASLVPASFGKPIQLALRASDYDAANDWAQRLRPEAAALGTLRGLEVEFDRESPRLSIAVDRRLAADLGLDVARIGETLRLFVGGADVTEFYRDGETYEVVVRGSEEDRDAPGDLAGLEARTAEGALTPLGSVIDATRIGAAAEYRRIDRRPTVVLSAAPREGADFAAITRTLERRAADLRPSSGDTAWLGLAREFTQSEAGTARAFGLALAVVYLVLAALFSSFLMPLVVMVAVPLAATAGLIALWLGGFSLTVFAQIGILLAIGLLAKNAILVVDEANRLRAGGKAVADAALEAATARFRPVLMTSIATFFGGIPLALATGPGAESRAVLGVTVMAGVAGSTLITLLLTPGLYRLAAPWTRPVGAISREVDKQQATPVA
jgi:multidrug efflux pump